MQLEIHRLKDLAKGKQKENIRFLVSLKKYRLKDVDNLFQDTHNEVFARTNCLECANCCKTTSPIFTSKDIARAAKALKLKPGTFIEKYLKIDDDNDYVLQQAPCPFLDEENYCRIYESRPAACHEYPHTNRKRMEQLFELTLKNSEICPAVYEILEALKSKTGLL